MAYKQRIKLAVRKTINSASLTGTYQAIGTPLEHPAYDLKILNGSNNVVDISIDGVNDHGAVLPNSPLPLDSCKVGLPTVQFVPAGTQFYAKGTAGTGLIYIIYTYWEQN